MKIAGVSTPLALTRVQREVQGSKAEVLESSVAMVEQYVEQEEPAEKQPVDPQVTQKAVDLINRTMKSYNTEVRFTMHEKSGEYMIKIINTSDNSVIREIPPESVLDMVAYFKEVLGLIVDKFI